MENPITMDDLGVPSFLETPKYVIYTHDACSLVFFSESLALVFRIEGQDTFKNGIWREWLVFPSDGVLIFLWFGCCWIIYGTQYSQ